MWRLLAKTHQTWQTQNDDQTLASMEKNILY